MDSFPLDFQDYLKEEGYSFQQRTGRLKEIYSFVCSPEIIYQLLKTSWEIADKINSLITHIDPPWESLYQFWTVVKRENRCLLTTRNQSFLLSHSQDSVIRLYKYRMACKDYECYVDSEVEEGGLGIIGRVFRHRSMETTPDVEYYTIQQYPLRDVAQSCGIKTLIAVPVFEPSGLCCVGVLEYLCLYTNDTCTVNDICKVISEVGLEPPVVQANHYGSHKDKKIKKAVPPMLKEIKKTLSESCKICEVHFCQAWAPCSSCNDVSSGDAMMGVLFQQSKARSGCPKYNLECLSNASFVHHLRKGQAIAGRASSSAMLSLCMDTTKLSIIDYPLAHFARYSNLNGRFAICLQSNHTRNNVYVLEFFFKYSGHPDTVLHLILEGMKKHLQSFKVASGQELGEKLTIIIIDSQTKARLDSIQKPEKIELVQHPIMDAMTTGRNTVIHEQSSISYSIQRIEERASMQQPSTMVTRRNNVIQDSNNIPDFVRIPEERDSVHQPLIDAMILGRNDVIEEPNNILSSCSKQARAMDAIRTKHNEFRISIGMSNMNEKRACIELADGTVVKQCLIGQPTNDASEDPNGILYSNLQQRRTRGIGGKQCRKSGIPIPLEDIQQQFGKKLQDAAASLGVSRSTLKRACREYEIFWWRPGLRNRGNHVANNVSNEDVPQDQFLPPSLDLPYQPPVAPGPSKMQDYLPLESTDNVDIKVMYGDRSAIKFQLSLLSGITGLKQQVVKRLNWIDFGNCSFHYKDEENDWISILCDEDLHDYLSSSTSSTKTPVTIYLKPFKL